MRKNSLKLAIIIYALLFVTLSIATILQFVLSEATDLAPLFFQLIAILLITFIFALCYLKKVGEKYILELAPKQLGAIAACIAIGFIASIFLYYFVTVLLMPVFLTAFLLSPLVKRKDVFLANLFSNIFVFSTIMIRCLSYCNNMPLAPIFMFLTGILAGSIVAFLLTYENRRFYFSLKAVIICLGATAVVVALSVIVFSPLESAYLEGAYYNEVLLIITTSPRFYDEMARSAAIFSFVAFFSQYIFTIILQPLFEKAFNLLTNARLMDLTDHNFPLMKRLINETPGTFNHALTVANFAEVCATAIGDNPYLARAAAYYHDIGKLENPQFFKENQQDENPHDSILPEVSAEIIRSHAEYGLELCKKYRIPSEISSVVIEHHGTMPITVFLVKAQSLTDGKVDIAQYSYKGPTPSSKIAAIIMICDIAEAAIRASGTDDPTKKDEIVSKLILERIQSGQFDDCDITLKELYTIKDTILSAFSGVHHKRIKYPDGK